MRIYPILSPQASEELRALPTPSVCPHQPLVTQGAVLVEGACTDLLEADGMTGTRVQGPGCRDHRAAGGRVGRLWLVGVTLYYISVSSQ